MGYTIKTTSILFYSILVKFLKLRTFHTRREMWLEFHQPFRESYMYCNCKRKTVSTNNELKQPQEVFPRPSSNASMLNFYVASRKPTFRSVLDAIVFFVEFLTGV